MGDHLITIPHPGGMGLGVTQGAINAVIDLLVQLSHALDRLRGMELATAVWAPHRGLSKQ
jgi:hypothetical protein